MRPSRWLALLVGALSAFASSLAFALSLGSASFSSGTGCNVGSLATTRCLSASITCPGVDPLTATIKITDPAASATGLFVSFNGGGSTAGYESQSQGATVLNDALTTRQRRVAQVWFAPGSLSHGIWNGSTVTWNDGGVLDGGDAGPVNLDGGIADGSAGGDGRPDTPIDRGCLGATLLRALYDDPTIFPPGGVYEGTGQSGGGSVLVYAFAWFNAGAFIDCAVITGGPPIALVREGCLGSLDRTWAAECATYTGTGGGGCGHTPGDTSAGMLDGIPNDGRTSCAVHAGGGSLDWDSWSAVYDGAQVSFPNTQIAFVYGDQDNSEAAKLGRGYAARIQTLGQAPKVAITTGSSCPHAVPACIAGAAAINAAFNGGTVNGVTFDACVRRH